jgi:formamidopyrimidine-DNA glycosylase
MPEILEAEYARQLIEARALGRVIAGLDANDAWYLKRGLTARAAKTALVGHVFTDARRRGKLLLLDTDVEGPTLALHLGMSGRVIVDGEAAGDPLRYTSNKDDSAWYRFGVRFADGGALHLRDPRRLGAAELDPDEERLGPDAFALTLPHLRTVLGRSRAPLKAVLMDQSRIAGLGNLITDEVLWRAGLDPAREARSLDPGTVKMLHQTIKRTLLQMQKRGGSHTGDLMAARFPGGLCPKDGTPLTVSTVGGRTTYWCRQHQR